MNPVSAAHQERAMGGGNIRPITFFSCHTFCRFVDLHTCQCAHKGANLVLVGCGRAHLITKNVVHASRAIHFSIVPCSLQAGSLLLGKGQVIRVCVHPNTCFYIRLEQMVVCAVCLETCIQKPSPKCSQCQKQVCAKYTSKIVRVCSFGCACFS